METARNLSRRLDSIEQRADDQMRRLVWEVVEDECGGPVFNDAMRREVFAEAMAESERALAELDAMRAAGVSERQIVAHFAAQADLSVEEFEQQLALEVARLYG